MRKTIGIIAFLVTLCFAKNVSAQQQPTRVNCGGGSYTDSKGQVWQSDGAFTAGGHGNYTTHAITGTPDQALFQTERWNAGHLVYTFNLPNGLYHVNILLAEIYFSSANTRVMNISLQGMAAFTGIDIIKEAGGEFAALTKSADATVTNGTLIVDMTATADNPKCAAIEILPVASGPSGPPLTLNFKYPDGTPVAGTLAYTVSSSLVSFQGSAPLNAGQAQCIIYANPSALGISAQFTVNLSLTDTAGHTLWQFAVAMDPSQVNLAAVQSSALNVVVQKM